MSRLTLTTVALATAAVLAVPAGASAAPSVDAAARLEAHAVLDSGNALSQARGAAARATRSLERSELAMKRAYAITIAQGKQSSSKGLDAAARFSASAQQQGDDLQALVERSHGSLKQAAADALARTSSMEADVVARVAKGLDQQEGQASAAQGQGVSDVGEAHAELAAAVAVTADSDGLKSSAQDALERARDKAIDAKDKLVQATEGMGKTQDSVQRSWEFSYEKTVSTGDGPVSATATVQAHAVVNNGGRR